MRYWKLVGLAVLSVMLVGVVAEAAVDSKARDMIDAIRKGKNNRYRIEDLYVADDVIMMDDVTIRGKCIVSQLTYLVSTPAISIEEQFSSNKGAFIVHTFNQATNVFDNDYLLFQMGFNDDASNFINVIEHRAVMDDATATSPDTSEEIWLMVASNQTLVATYDSDLTLSGDVLVNGDDISSDDALTINSGSGLITLETNVFVIGRLDVASVMTVTQGVTVGGTLDVTDDVQLQNNIGVKGTAAFTGGVDMISTLNVGGDVHLAGDVGIAVDAVITGTLAVVDAVDLQSTVSASGSVYSAGILTTGTDIVILRDATIASNASVGTGLTVGDAASFGGTSVLVGASAFGGAVRHEGDVTFSSGANAVFADGSTDEQATNAIGFYRYAEFEYDVLSHGGGTGAAITISGPTLPDNAVIVDGYVEVVTPFTQTGTLAAISFNFEATADMFASYAVTGANFQSAGFLDLVPDDTAATLVKATSAQAVTVDMLAQPATQGVARVFARWFQSQ